MTRIPLAAAPPVGDLRWQPPRPAAPWQGVRTADRFAKTGNPNARGLPVWPAFDPDAHVTMELGERAGPMPVDSARR